MLKLFRLKQVQEGQPYSARIGVAVGMLGMDCGAPDVRYDEVREDAEAEWQIAMCSKRTVAWHRLMSRVTMRGIVIFGTP